MPAPRDCNCSLLSLTDAEGASKEIALLDDTGVYFVPAEADLFRPQFTPQPFLISNPVKFTPNINRIKKGSVDKKDNSHESSERLDTYESRNTFIRASNDDASQPPSYLDLEIHEEANSETLFIQQSNSIPSFESAEKVLAECLDLHILEFTRKFGSVENFSDIWEVRNLKIYEDLSDSDLDEKIKKYCSETDNLIKQTLEDIKTGVPKKKVNRKYISEDKNDNDKTYEIKESFELESLNTMAETTSFADSRTDSPSLHINSIQHNLLTEHNIDNSVSQYESSSESSSTPYLFHKTSPNADKNNESKSIEINSYESDNTLSVITIFPTQNTEKDYDTDSDMDTMASEVIFKKNSEINQLDFKQATNKPHETTILSLSTTPLNDVLSSIDPSSATEQSWSKKQAPSPSIFLITDPIFDEATTLSTLKSPISEGHMSGTTVRSVTEKEEGTTETPEFGLDLMPSVILKSNNKTDYSGTNMTSNELILDNASLLPALTTLKYNLLEDLRRNSSVDHKEKQGQDEEGKELDLDTEPSEIILKSNNEPDKIGSKLTVDNTIFYSTSTAPKSAEILSSHSSSHSETSKVEKEGDGENEGMRRDFVTTTDITFKPNNEFFGNKPVSDDVTFFPTESINLQKHKVSLDSEGSNTELSISKLPEKYIDADVELDLKTTPYKMMNIGNSRSTLDDTFNFPTSTKGLLNQKPLVNVYEKKYSRSSPEEATSVSLAPTTPEIAIQSRHRNKFSESEVKIPSIVTKECQNNVIKSSINGKEALPNSDFEDTEAKEQYLQEKNKQVNSDHYSDINLNSSLEGIDESVMFNNSYISGNLYFGSGQDLVPVRLQQTHNGKVTLGIDGHSLCEKLSTSKQKSLLLSTLCDCVFKITKNNSTEYFNK